jgi:hypothetical protein
MADSNQKPTPNLFQTLRQARDAGLSSAARAVLAVTASPRYSRAVSTAALPGLILAGLVRRRTEAAMTQLLSQMNMPSRTDVLALSTRLTHIETTLDDLSAAVGAMRPSAARTATPVARASVRRDRPAAVEGK